MRAIHPIDSYEAKLVALNEPYFLWDKLVLTIIINRDATPRYLYCSSKV